MSVISTYNYQQAGAISGSRVLNGSSLAHRQMSPRQRHSLIEAMADGSVVITPLTVTQGAAVLRASPFAVYSDRYRCRKAWRNSDTIAPSEPITTTIPTDDEIDAVIQRVGIDRVWDRMSAMIA
jgi:hypothetical protein